MVPRRQWPSVKNLGGTYANRSIYMQSISPFGILYEKNKKVLYGEDADLSYPKIIGTRAFIHIKDPSEHGHTSREVVVYGLNEKEGNFYHVLKSRAQGVVEARIVVLRSSLRCKDFSRHLCTSLKTPSMTTIFRARICSKMCATTRLF